MREQNGEDENVSWISIELHRCGWAVHCTASEKIARLSYMCPHAWLPATSFRISNAPCKSLRFLWLLFGLRHKWTLNISLMNRHLLELISTLSLRTCCLLSWRGWRHTFHEFQFEGKFVRETFSVWWSIGSWVQLLLTYKFSSRVRRRASMVFVMPWIWRIPEFWVSTVQFRDVKPICMELSLI